MFIKFKMNVHEKPYKTFPAEQWQHDNLLVGFLQWKLQWLIPIVHKKLLIYKMYFLFPQTKSLLLLKTLAEWFCDDFCREKSDLLTLVKVKQCCFSNKKAERKVDIRTFTINLCLLPVLQWFWLYYISIAQQSSTDSQSNSTILRLHYFQDLHFFPCCH